MNTPVFADSEQMRILLYDLTYSPGGGWPYPDLHMRSYADSRCGFCSTT